MGQWKKRFQASIAGAASLCLLLVGLNHSGGYLQSQAATLTYETVHTISDFSSTTYLGMTNATLDTELYRSAPSSMKFAVPEGSSGVIWRTTYPEPIDLSDGGKYTLEDLGLAFWIYMDTTETNYVYMFQLDSAGSWSKTVLWNKWRNTLTTATGQWAYVVLPLRDATNNGFDITSFRGFRVTQMGSDKPAHTFHIDDLQVVNLNASSYSWEAADIGITTAFSGDNLMLDDRFDLTCAVKNRDKAVAMTGWTMKATVNERLLQIEGDDTQGFSVAAGGTETITLPLLALDGGTGGITLEFFDDNNKLIASREVPVEIGGKRNWSREDIGFTLSWSDDRPAAGETVTLGYTLTNKSKTADISGWTISCRYSPLWIAGDDAPHTVSVPADTSFDGSFSLTFEEGGSGSVLIDLTDGKGNLLSTESIPVTVSGSGYYLGDTHTHSTASDGVGNFLENFQAGREKGMSWIYATDHNADIAQSFDRVQFDAAKSLMRNAGFLAMYGTEITTHMGHMVAYDVDTYYIPDSTDETHSDIPRNITAGAWQTVIDRIAADGALSYLAHPFATTPYPGLGMDPTNTDVYSGYTGIEIINQGESVERYDGNTVSSTLKVYATEYWDRMNIKGEKKYFGISSTDAHATTDVGGFFNGLLLEGLREDNINTALATGSFYGSAGPELRFSLGGKTMGETVYAAVDAQIPIVVKAYNKDAPITKVVLYAFDIGADGIETAYRAGRDNAAVLFEDTDGSEGRNTFEYTGALPLKPGTFYRVEVYADDDLHGYAFSNPIWMEEGEEPESRHIAAKENTFIIRDGQLIVSNPPKAMTAADCLNRLSPSSGLSVYEDGKPVTGETRLKDGMTVRLAAGPDIWEELTVVLRSDSHPLKPDGDAVTGCHAPSGTVPVYTHIYTISDFSKASGIGISSAVYAADDGHDAPGSFVIKPAASLWKTGDAADLTPYTGGDNVGLALRFWFKTDTLTAGNRYTVQITSSAAWGSPCLQWSF